MSLIFLISRANGELDSLDRRSSADLSALEALLKKTESKTKALEAELSDKKEESKQLTQICDELIEKVANTGRT